ncbi:rhomboid family intramembrane serine protease [Bacillus kwashiorkori]|uniref:rhomboid family intramembrane serine protease n=1 Tax=Bacillus kwashiorkori TaxID=1522318 RepID=UPI0007865489|nr:rhomboid family intramembrane serine protease [Bacillus kwashiorkori]
MSSREDFIYWSMVRYFIFQKHYRLIHLSENQNEIWLVNRSHKKFPLIHLQREDVDWSNRLKQTIELTAVNAIRLRKSLFLPNKQALNIVVSALPPVDSYEYLLEKPLQLDKGKMTVYSSLIAGAESSSQIQSVIHLFGDSNEITLQDDYDSLQIAAMRETILRHAVKEMKNEQSLFNYSKPLFTYIFLAIQIVIFLLLELSGGSTDPYVLLQFGAKYNPAILAGEWWRFITPMFIHIGVLHLLMNSIALYYLGSAVEKLYGNFRFLFIYLFSGIAGSIASFVFNPFDLSAGASGAIFGCFGALLYFGLEYPHIFFRTMGMNILFLLGFNLIFGFTVPGIDNSGHIGGLIGGFLATGIFHFPKKTKKTKQLLFLLVTVLLTIFTLFFGYKILPVPL